MQVPLQLSYNRMLHKDMVEPIVLLISAQMINFFEFFERKMGWFSHHV